MSVVGTEPDSAPAEHGVFVALAHLVIRRRRLVLVLFVLGVLGSAFLGGPVLGALKTAGYDDPTSESARAQAALDDQFGVQEPVIALAVQTPAGLDEPDAARQAVALVGEVGAVPGVTSTVSYWTSGRPEALAGVDGLTGQVLVYAVGTTEQEQTELAGEIAAEFGGPQGDLVVYVGGFATVSDAITSAVKADLARAESLAIPITLVLLVVVFGSLVAAGLPFTVAVGAIIGSLLVVRLVTQVADVSIFSLNLITGLGLGLGIDYALLVVNRFREELDAGRDTEDAVVRTVATAGRTVVVSGVTVAVVLASLLFFPQYFLRSFGYAGIAVTLLAVVTTLTALPALLAVLGPRVDRLKVRRGELAPRDEGAWSRIARTVMRRPWPVMLGVTGVLVVLALPALS
ncbi:MAG TPA: MMPL family transporter, partial [Ornithinibacter sp.]|nr:MMPL family transporter [Ornithinibacter sp.]